MPPRHPRPSPTGKDYTDREIEGWVPVITVRIPPPPLGAKIGVTPDDGKHEILRKREAALRAWMDDEWDLVEVDGIRRPEALRRRAPTAPSKSSRSSRTTDPPEAKQAAAAPRAPPPAASRMPPHAAGDASDRPPDRSRRAAARRPRGAEDGPCLHLRHLRTPPPPPTASRRGGRRPSRV